MKSKKIVLIGGGGHCHSVLDSLLQLGTYDEIGIVERTAGDRSQMFGIPIVGTDAELPRLLREGWEYAVVAVGSVGVPTSRRTLVHSLKKIGFALPVVIDPSAVISCTAEIGEGTFVGKRAVVNSGTHVGCCAIINTGVILEHDCTIGDFAHIAPGCTLCGEVSVGRNTHVGAGSVVRQKIQIGSDSLIGAGSAVVSHVADHTKAFGNPCRVVGQL